VIDHRRTLAANALYAGVGAYAEYAAAFIVSIVVARCLTPEDFGTYTLLLWIGSVGVLLANNGITTGVMKFLGEARGQRRTGLARSVLVYCERMQLWSSAVTCAVLALVITCLPGLVIDARARPLLWVVLPVVLLRSLFVYYLSAAKGFEQFGVVARVLAFAAPLGLLIVLVLARTGARLEGFLIAYAGVCLLYVAAMRVAVFRAIVRGLRAASDRAPMSRIHRHVAYASAIVLLELLIVRQLELFFLDRFSTREAVGAYGLGRSLAASAILLTAGVFTSLLLPVMSRTFGEDPRLLGRRFRAATRYLVMLVVPVVLLCEVFAADVITTLYGAAYAEAVPVFRISVAVSALGAISSSASSYQVGTGRQAPVVSLMAAAAAVSVVLDYTLIQAFGLNGAIAAGAVGSTMLAVALLRHAAASLNLAFEWSAYARLTAAGVIAAIPALIVRAAMPLWIALPAAAVLLLAGYAGLAVLLGGWTRDELGFMRTLTVSCPDRLGRPLRAVLAWAEGGTCLVPAGAEPPARLRGGDGL
jgi:O-antigen/teichoic acid export membrane protein